MRMRHAIALAGMATVLTTCTDQRPPTSPNSAATIPGGPEFAISDGAHSGGNPDFFFLPPLAPPPQGNPNFDRGQFNPNLSPTVEICNGAALTPQGDCVTPLRSNGQPAVFTAVRGWDGLPDWVDPQQYHVLWQTRNYSLVADGKHVYRIVVKVGTALLGYLDVVPTTTLLGALKVTAGGQDVGWLNNLVVPIRFRIENGALCTPGTNAADCSENTVVGAAAGSPGDTTRHFVVPSGYAALALPPGAIKPGDTVTIVIENEAPPYGSGQTAQCLPTDLSQSKGCWHFSSEPALYQFVSPVRMEVCVDVEYLTPDEQEHVQLYKYNTTEGLQRLDSVPPTLIDCSSFTTTASAAGSAPSSFASAALRRLGKWAGSLVAPPLYASLPTGGVPKGLGGTGGSFSDVGGAVPATGLRTASIGVTPAGAPIVGVGGTATFSAVAEDDQGKQISGKTFLWASLNPNVATVNSTTGFVTAVANGQATISASVDGVTGYGLVTVSTPSVKPVNLWARMTSPATEMLNAVWATSPTDIFAVGYGGTILHYDGSAWSVMQSGTDNELSAVSGTSSTDVWAGGFGPTIMHYDGSAWSASPVSADVRSVWAASPSDVYAVGQLGPILHYNGTTWSTVPNEPDAFLLRVWGSSTSDVFAAGTHGTILHFDGTQWVSMPNPASPNSDVTAVWGTASNAVYATGNDGKLLRYDGSSWSVAFTDFSFWGGDVWGSSGSDIYMWASTTGGPAIVRYDGATAAVMPGTQGIVLNQIWGAPGGDVFGVGGPVPDTGYIFRGYRGATVAVTAPGTTINGELPTLQLTAQASDASQAAIADVTFTWTSDNPDAVIVDQNGVVTGGQNPGTATITATAPGGAVGAILITYAP